MFVHGDNLEQKETHKTKYRDNESKDFLIEIRQHYNAWRQANEALKGPGIDMQEDDSLVIAERVRLLNEYKDFLDQERFAVKFDSRSNLHSSVLEEFMYYLFRDLTGEISVDALIGKSHSFKDVFFRASSYRDMLKNPCVFVEKKDHDFAIGVSISSSMMCKGGDAETYEWDVPAVAIECKTYLDKTMLQDVSTAADQLKQKNPNAVYIVVAEWIKLTEAINLRKYKIDQIYVVRKQRNTDREFRFDEGYQKNPIYPDVVEHLFNYVRTFLLADWEGGMTHGLNRGFLI